jgi:hypothetical protein
MNLLVVMPVAGLQIPPSLYSSESLVRPELLEHPSFLNPPLKLHRLIKYQLVLDETDLEIHAYAARSRSLESAVAVF